VELAHSDALRASARCRELNGAPLLDRCGYLWCTRDAALADEMAAEARADPRGGVFDSVSAFASSQEGVRVLRGGAQIAAAFPYLRRVSGRARSGGCARASLWALRRAGARLR
jgi:hypothetical protein